MKSIQINQLLDVNSWMESDIDHLTPLDIATTTTDDNGILRVCAVTLSLSPADAQNLCEVLHSELKKKPAPHGWNYDASDNLGEGSIEAKTARLRELL